METRLLLDIPSRFETERLVIRSPQAGDGKAVHEAVRETFSALHEWMPWAKEMQTPEQSEDFACKSQIQFLAREDFILTAWDKRSGEFVVSSGLHPCKWEVPSFEIGYWVRASREGQGYVSEVVRGIASFGFDVFFAKRLEIRCDVLNGRSAQVAERCGFKLEGVLRSDNLDNRGVPRDTKLFSLLAAERDPKSIPSFQSYTGRS